MAAAVLQLRRDEFARPDPRRIDSISLLPNRQQFHADQVYWGRETATLVLFTLADARTFNEILRALGHARAEGFIRAGAQRLLEILGPGTSLYHVGILNFVFRLPGSAEPDRPAIIDRIVEGFRAPVLVEDVPIDTRVGLGMKSSRGPASSPAEDLRATLSAAQDSRLSARGWAWYDRASDEAHRRGFRLLTDLKAALRAENQLELHFQPKVALGTDACSSAEALLRWTHPELGPVSPGEFVPLVETTALVAPMTRWVIGAAVEQAAAWARQGRDLTLAINVSPKNLEEADFIEYLLFCCAARKLDRDRIEIEVTEGVNAAHGALILDRLSALNRLGFSIAIDDFGSGYSNMSYLTKLSAQTLKIDQSLVRGVEPDALSGRLVSGIVQMGRDLGYRIVAEGVETEGERDLLAQWGCDYGQGWHFGRPMPVQAFETWLDGRS
jgi:EAL domain-containing protein (putative c-di-GMP-specific phosphodiesterase class I)/GGDEF domain-containing protein